MALDQSHEGSRTAPDHDEIVRHMQLYIDGFNQSDVSKFRQCFDEDAWILFTDAEGSLRKGPLPEVFDEWAGPDEVKDWEHRVLSVTQAGDVASVILEMHSASDPEERWVASTGSGRT